MPLHQSNEDSFVFVSQEVLLPRLLIEFKLIRIIKAEVKWELIDKNHFIYLGDQNCAQIFFREEKSDVTIITEEEKSFGKKGIQKEVDPGERDKFREEIKVTGEESVIIVSAELPITFVKTADDKWTTIPQNKPMYSSIHRSLLKNFKDFKWIGRIEIPEEADKDMVAEELAKQNCVPVYLSRDLVAKSNWYYEKVLYPFCHNFIGPTDDYEQLSNDYWEAYKATNQEYANVVVEHSGSNPLIWINDMHLLMCPLQIIRRNVIANIGLFIHTSFPSGEVFKTFPHREEFLWSMLCCNIIGFHILSYARNFSIACGRILGIAMQLS